MEDKQDLTKLTAEIVSSYVSHNSIPTSELTSLIQSVHVALGGTQAAPEAQEELTPVVSVRASVKPDHIVCLACGAKNKMLKRHLASAHGLTSDEYRARYKLPADYPLVAPQYAATRSKLAKKIGLGQKKA
jgi:predicted transcriptional regulator